MAKLAIEDFLVKYLNFTPTVISTKGWARGCCPIHGETRPSFGVHMVSPYLCKCFSCGYKKTLPFLVADIRGIRLAKAVELVQENVEIKLDVQQLLEYRGGECYIPDAILETYTEALPNSMASRYLRYRKTPPWAARMLGIGYDHLNRSMTVPMRNVNTGKVQGFALYIFGGTFEEVDKEKRDANSSESITVPVNYRKYSSCIVVEGAFDAMNFMKLYGLTPSFKNVCPVVLNTSHASKSQLNFIRANFDKIILGLDHDFAGKKGTQELLKSLRDRSKVFEFVYPEEVKDLGELRRSDDVHLKLFLTNRVDFGI